MNNDWVEDYLMHFGIPRMRWGVRRFQNPDGSLTARGRKRYSSAAKKSDMALASGDVKAYAKTVRTRSKASGYASEREITYRDEAEIRGKRSYNATEVKSGIVDIWKSGNKKERERLLTYFDDWMKDVNYNERPEIDRKLETVRKAREKLNDNSPLNDREREAVKKFEYYDNLRKTVDADFEAVRKAIRKTRGMNVAKETDQYDIDFLEAVQNESWLTDRSRLLKEYERYWDNDGFSGYVKDLEERRKKGLTEPQP